jgi:hypothetical protein
VPRDLIRRVLLHVGGSRYREVVRRLRACHHLGDDSTVERDGIPPWMLSTMRWTAAIVGLVLLVSFTTPRVIGHLQQSISLNAATTDDDLPDAEDADTEPDAVVEDVVLAGTDVATRNGTVEGGTAPAITLAGDGFEQMIIGFDAIPQDTACLIEVTLEAFMAETTGAEVHVLPGILQDISALEEGQALQSNAVIENSAPSRAYASEGTSGWLRWDVTSEYRLAARSARQGASVVLVLRHFEDDEEAGAITVFGTTDHPEDWAPRLRWSAVSGPDGAGCEGLGGGASDGQGDLLEGEVAEDEEGAEEE